MIKKVDHIVITVQDKDATVYFYKQLGFTYQEYEGKCQLHAGDFKINIHELGKEFLPHAQHIQSGSADMCFEIIGDIEIYKANIEKKGIVIELGIVPRYGTRGFMRSLYLRDPDGNLLEFCSYTPDA